MIGWNITVRKRLILIFYITILLFCCLAYRLICIQAFQRDRYKKLADNQHRGRIELPALRGSILDRKYEPLANSIALPSLAADPTKIKDRKAAATIITSILGGDRKEMELLLSTQSTFVWIARKADVNLVQKIMDNHLDGLFVLKEPSGRRFYSKANLASHILGSTGIDDQGLDGIEASLDDYLKGKPGVMETEMDRDGMTIPGGYSSLTPAVPGNNIVLTIDERIQYITECALEKSVKEHKAKSGSIIVMDARTGEILAMANRPDFRPDNFGAADARSRRNICVCDAYEPGSTFKVVTAAIALESGKVGLEDNIPCGNSIEVGGWSLRNANDGFGGNPTEKISDIIAYSFNTGTAAIGLRIGCKTYFEYLKKFGFGEVTGIELPGETDGLVLPLQEWTEINLATMSFGQGIAITPLQIVSAVQAIANGGVQMKPHILKEIIDSKGNVVKAFPPEIKGRPISPDTAYKMVQILQGVVDRGTGKKAKVPGYLCAGKTGTASIVENGQYASGKYNASFVGFVPAEDPRLVIIVKIECPQDIPWGGVVAGPVFKEIAQESLWRLGIAPSFPNEVGKTEEEKQ